ncbi:hypothetical protein [Mycobacterium sp.]|uniref:hypothetical protein n=1 Tax=Mycobacterium sp. TaxID=1785 RepID=UPI0033418DE8
MQRDRKQHGDRECRRFADGLRGRVVLVVRDVEQQVPSMWFGLRGEVGHCFKSATLGW